MFERLDISKVKPKVIQMYRDIAGTDGGPVMKIVLVSLASRGGMLHFQVELANALSRIASTAVVMSSAAPVSYLEHAVRTSVVRTGRGALGSIANACNPVVVVSASGRDLAAGRADLVHVTGAHAWNPLVAVLHASSAASRCSTPSTTLRSIGGAPLSIRISNWITTRMADAVIVLTRYGERAAHREWSSGAEDPHNPARSVFLLPQVAALEYQSPEDHPLLRTL